MFPHFGTQAGKAATIFNVAYQWIEGKRVVGSPMPIKYSCLEVIGDPFTYESLDRTRLIALPKPPGGMCAVLLCAPKILIAIMTTTLRTARLLLKSFRASCPLLEFW